MENSLFTDKDYVLWVLLVQARDAIFRLRQRELKPHAISLQEAAILFLAWFLGNRATPSELSRWVLRKHHTILGILSRMEKKGLIKKVKGLSGKNRVEVTLTEKGEQAFNRSLDIDCIHRIMSSLSGEERRQLALYLETLRDMALGELGETLKPPYPRRQ